MTMREIRPADHDGVNALWDSVWWPTRSEAGWRWLAANPVLPERPAPQGWVYADEHGAVKAVLGAIVQRFWRGDDRFYGLTGHSLVVSPDMRGASRHMINRILAQPGFFGCYTLNANVLSHRIYGRFGFISHPLATAHIKLAWVIDPAACLMGNILRRGLEPHPKLARRISERLLSPDLWREKPLRLPAGVAPLRDFDAAYDRFWRNLKGEGRLITDRGPEIQRWRVSDPDQTLRPLMFKYERDGEIAGYACAMFSKENPIEPVVLEIIDLAALSAAPEAVPALMAALMTAARARGAAKLRLAMINPRLLEQLGGYARSARREGGWAHAHIHLSADALDIGGWAPTPFDGDLFMSLRAPPWREGAGRAAG
jgi:GNAT superfamily N-acetyltransferase